MRLKKILILFLLFVISFSFISCAICQKNIQKQDFVEKQDFNKNNDNIEKDANKDTNIFCSFARIGIITGEILGALFLSMWPLFFLL